MLYLLSCSCGEKHHVSTSQAGQEITCKCGKSIRIPTLRGIRGLPQVDSGRESEPVSSGSAWGGWRGPAMAIATGVFLVAAASSGYFLYQRLQIDTSFTAETAIQFGDEMLDQYGPYELSYIWNTYQTEGLGLKRRPDYYLWNQYAQERVYLATMTGLVAAVSACLAAVIWISVRRV